jgi:hypothetical protein
VIFKKQISSLDFIMIKLIALLRRGGGVRWRRRVGGGGSGDAKCAAAQRKFSDVVAMQQLSDDEMRASV